MYPVEVYLTVGEVTLSGGLPNALAKAAAIPAATDLL